MWVWLRNYEWHLCKAITLKHVQDWQSAMEFLIQMGYSPPVFEVFYACRLVISLRMLSTMVDMVEPAPSCNHLTRLYPVLPCPICSKFSSSLPLNNSRHLQNSDSCDSPFKTCMLLKPGNPGQLWIMNFGHNDMVQGHVLTLEMQTKVAGHSYICLDQW